jgi:hypothetical protein
MGRGHASMDLGVSGEVAMTCACRQRETDTLIRWVSQARA